MADKFMGYWRKDGSVGVRNLIAIIPSVFCSAKVAERIAYQVPGSVYFRHPVGCSQVGEDLEITARTLIQIGRNPNFSGVVVVGLGCERFSPYELAEGIAPAQKMLETVVIQKEGDSLAAIQKGVKYARKMQQMASRQQREEADVSHLMIGLNCGGSDMTSGLVANPALGIASDMLVSQGGSSILAEITELLGTEHILARRAVNEQVAQEIKEIVSRTEKKLERQTRESSNVKRTHLISTGNYDGGLSSVVEKSLGSMKKSGNAPFSGTIQYAETPKVKGLLLMDSPGHDGEVSTGQVAAGAQMIVFPTGRGTPTGFPGVPVLKITGNPKTYEKMKENIDINAGEVLLGKKTLQQMGEEIYREILEVASGKMVKAEILGHDEQFCITRMT
ncbi:UxaA family hydrolase [Paenibacillus naphthalenovorans]|uniref:UxaA family hydrolase n=1 Tax=Paenibacillus naphthalenovorans TaxID=162209 RepID=UPI0008918793|nr:UxaA family hydrolase [Paenibacillus naphthalenovorans]GCL71877.1 galactonate dehydratase [Paenibacillus naphthalenovorans]SDI41363.1 altronate dehydratase large subunit [Paenibacillus naphthalenovorans]